MDDELEVAEEEIGEVVANLAIENYPTAHSQGTERDEVVVAGAPGGGGDAHKHLSTRTKVDQEQSEKESTVRGNQMCRCWVENR